MNTSQLLDEAGTVLELYEDREQFSDRAGGTRKRPSVFIGSSSEGLRVASAIAIRLDSCSEPTVWNEGVFKPTKGYLESLYEALPDFEFAVLVFTPDDVLECRGRKGFAPRDNVLFELGLFLGKLGRDRTFVVCDQEATRLASDLHGLSLLEFRKPRDGNIMAAVRKPCFELCEAIEKLRLAEGNSPVNQLLGPWLYKSETRDLNVWGKAKVHLVGDTLRINGARTRTVEKIGGHEEEQENRFVWSSKWASLFKDDRFRFVWEAHDGGRFIEGYCDLNLTPDHPELMEGNFYMLPPDDHAGHILFSRPTKRSKTSS